MRRTHRAVARLTSCPAPRSGVWAPHSWWRTVCWPSVLMMVLLVAFAFGPLLATGAAGTTAPAPVPAPAPALASPAGPLPAAPPEVRSEIDDGATLDVEILSQSTPTLQAGESLTMHVRVTNVSADAVQAATVDLLAQEWTPSTRFATARWADEDRYTASRSLATMDVPPLAPGQSTDLLLTATADSFRVSGWGPRGIEVRVTPSDPAAPPDRERSWVTFWAGEDLTPTPLTVIAPLTAGLAEWNDPAALAARTTTLLAQAELPGVTLAVDPSLLALLDDDTRAAVTATLPALDVWALPWSDVDARALVEADRADLLDGAAARSEAELAAAGVDSGGLMDLDGGTDEAVLAESSGVTVLSSAQISTWLEGTYTPGARVTLTTAASSGASATSAPAPPSPPESGDSRGATFSRDALVADAALAEALDGTIAVDGDTYTLDAARTPAYLTALTAAYTRERPSMERPLAIVLPRNDAGADLPSLAVLVDLPWITPTPLADVLEMESLPYGLDVVPSPALPRGAVTSGEITEAALAQDLIAVASELSAEYAEAAAPQSALLDHVAALAWRSDSSGRSEAISVATGGAQALLDAVRVQPGSTINMLSESSNFPLTVSSSADVPLTVVIDLDAPDGRLRQDAMEPIVVPPNGQVTSQVPVIALGSGDLTVYAQLLTVSGEPVGEPVPIEMRLRIEWENAMLVGLIAVGIGAFVLGIIRTAQRNRRTKRAAVVEAATAELDKLMHEEDQ